MRFQWEKGTDRTDETGVFACVWLELLRIFPTEKWMVVADIFLCIRNFYEFGDTKHAFLMW